MISYFVSGAAPLFGIRDVFDGGRRNIFHSIAGKKRLMAGDDNVWKSEQLREYVVAEDQPGAILEKDLLFLFVNIDSWREALAASRNSRS